MLPGLFFLTTRCLELLFLIPLIGMLSYLVHGYVALDLLTPNFILVLFIVSVLAGVWALGTALFYPSTRRNGHFVALIDLGIFIAFIAGVAVLRGIGNADCMNINSFSLSPIGISLVPFVYDLGHACGVLKASFAFGIINIILFFFSFLYAIWIHHHYRSEHPETTTITRERYHSSRSGNRRSSGGSRAGSRAPSRAPRSRSGDGYRYDDRRRSGGARSTSGYDRRSYV